MRGLKTLFKNKDKKTRQNLLLLFAAGVALLVLGKTLSKKPATSQNTSVSGMATNSTAPAAPEDYATQLEKKLAAILSHVENAGRVEVLIKLSHGKELVVAEDVRTEQSNSREADYEGGTRVLEETARDGQTVRLRLGDGSEVPLILQEIEPQVAGVLIIAEGGGDIFVKDALTRAAYTVLGVEPHKVQVLKMESKNR